MVDKIKKSPDNIKNEILNQLKSGPKTISEISVNINSNWLTTEKFLEELKNDKKIFELISSPKSKYFSSFEDPAFYSLPFSEKTRNETSLLLSTIAKIWKEKTGENPPKTILQKIAVAFVEESKIDNIPILRFHYGQTLALRYDETIQITDEFGIGNTKRDILLDLIDKYSPLSSKEAKLLQYQKKGMEIYLEKETKTANELSCGKEYKDLENSFLKLSAIYPTELHISFNLFDRFIYCSINLLNLKDNDKKREYFEKIKEVFYLLWDCMTTESFFYDSERYIPENKKELFFQIKSNILNSKITNLSTILEDLEEEVNSIDSNEINSETSEEIQEFLHELITD